MSRVYDSAGSTDTLKLMRDLLLLVRVGQRLRDTGPGVLPDLRRRAMLREALAIKMADSPELSAGYVRNMLRVMLGGEDEGDSESRTILDMSRGGSSVEEKVAPAGDPSDSLRSCVHSVVGRFFQESGVVCRAEDARRIGDRISHKVLRELGEDLRWRGVQGDLHERVYRDLSKRWGTAEHMEMIVRLSNAKADRKIISCFKRLMKTRERGLLSLQAEAFGRRSGSEVGAASASSAALP